MLSFRGRQETEGQAMILDLETLSLKELRQLQKDVEAAISDYKDREKRKALAEVEAFMREKGLNPADLSDLIGGKRGKKTVGTAKYANPADPSQTWTGRGRKPGWVTAHLEAGGALDSLAI
jgi:DNA-binding protein H-NS